uniref:Rho guanine nucleotide exchange factor 17 n=1 Tax=Scleropages formosus TaxID=113540 RepID=A0A8C9W958_SCLFO
MAGRQARDEALVSRSVSFKQLASWSANRSAPGREDVEPVALPPPTAESARSSDRKVSKISAAAAATTAVGSGEPERSSLTHSSHSSHSPSVRQLSQKFSRTAGRSCSSGVSGVSAARCEGLRALRARREADAARAPDTSADAAEGTSGSEPEARPRRLTEPRAAARRDREECAGAGVGAPPPRRSAPAAPGDAASASASGALGNWPSVPRIRQLFGDAAALPKAPRDPDSDFGTERQGDEASRTPDPHAEKLRGDPKGTLLPRGNGVEPPGGGPPLSCGRRQQQAWDSLHSSRSFRRAAAGDEDAEERAGVRRAPVSFQREANGSWAESPGRSSGSEEDGPEPLATARDGGSRRRSLRRRRKSGVAAAGARHHALSDDSDGVPVMECLRSSGSRYDRCAARPGEAGRDGPRGPYGGVTEGGGAAAAPPMTVVSRVSKVNIPSFVSSPCDSRSSSRYSSTETLKEDEQLPRGGRATTTAAATSSCIKSKTFHGNFTMYRTPSFGHGDNFPRAQVRVRARPTSCAATAGGAPPHRGASHWSLGTDKDKHGMSVSNPDITSETLSLISFLKTDLSELKVGKKGRPGADRGEDGGASASSCSGMSGASSLYRMGSRGHSSWQQRPSLKDLTATLRRANSFTYSDQPPEQRRVAGGATKRSSSEQRLDTAGDIEAALSDREVQSDDCQRSDTFEEQMPTPLRERYIQEAQQVIQDICEMGARGDDDEDDEGRRLGKKVDDEQQWAELGPREKSGAGAAQEHLRTPCSGGSHESERALRKGRSDENVFCDKSQDELSGHESSLTDEGIVTEPESARDAVGQTLSAWKQSGLFEEERSELRPENEPSPPVASQCARAECESVVVGAETVRAKSMSPGLLEAPSTPGAIRRRRKFSSAGNGSSDSSNGSNGESSGEAYRSLSDPMPHRRRSLTEDCNTFSVDSNLLGALNAKAAAAEASAGEFSECTGSAASDLSESSEGPRDYSSLLQSIVREPGAMGKLSDDKAAGKAVKKKSFSDPSRRGEPAATDGSGFAGPREPISELEQVIPPSSSEPVLSEQRGGPGELDEEQPGPDGKPGVRSVRTPPSNPECDDRKSPSFPFDPELAKVLSPHTARRSYRKRNGRAAVPQPASDPERPVPPHPLKPRAKHVRHASEPVTFVPIVPPEAPLSAIQDVEVSVPTPSRPRPNRGDPAPSLEDVTKQYILALNTADTGPGLEGGAGSTPATPTTGEPKLPRKASEDPAPGPQKAKVDMRKHVMMTLVDTEKSYVESLRTLIQGYMKPLKHPENSLLCDPSLVDEMFYQIPEMLEHHEQFLEGVVSCVDDWHDRQLVGHLLVESQSMRENKDKQALADLMIKPVQRIPRYELLVKDLLKHTPEEHPDHLFLLDAQKNIKRLAERVNKGRRSAEEAEREARVMQEIEAHIEGVEHILNPQRKFLRQEMVVEAKTVGGKKDRSLFLFSDLLICTTLKRKSGSLRRSSMSLYSAASVIDTSSKYKFLWKLPLEEVELVKGSSQSSNRENIQKNIGRLDEDLSTLGQISKLSETLSFPHQSLDDVIKELMASVHRELAEKQSLAFSSTFLPTKVELTTASAESSFVFEFTSPDARGNFEQALEDAKKKLAMSKDHWDPEFLKAIPIMKTRSGMQFSCASPSHSCPESPCEVWVCNSDGYVGQVCLLNIRDEPTVEACIAVCSARIICIAAVPGLKGRERSESVPSGPAPSVQQPQQQQRLHISISGSSLELVEPRRGAGRELVPFDSDDTDDEDSPSPSSTLQSQASRSTISSSFGRFADDEGTGSKDMATETTSSEEEQEFPAVSPYGGGGGGGLSAADGPVDGRAMRRSSRGSFTRASLEDLLSIDPEAYQSSVWLGTEDGCIHVYQSSDNIRNRKNSMKMQHAASILCILYLDNKVFVSLANGEVIVYQREAGSFWDPQSSQTLVLGTPGGPVTKMVPVAGRLWCGCQNRILIINTSTLVQEHSFQVGQDSGRCVTSMVSYGQGVWVSLQGSATVRLYHAVTYESLTEVDVAPTVHKMLASSDAIIRQHKAACLRITALLACKDLLWVGTSAGVVLTLSIPPVSASGGPASLRGPLVPMGSVHGHTGHVRFLTAIELPEGFDLSFPPQVEPGNPAHGGEGGGSGLQRRDSAHRRASAVLVTKSSMLVISGGDGYEDFRMASSSETVGRDDSTNHLLLWRV